MPIDSWLASMYTPLRMNVEFNSGDLDRLETDAAFTAGWETGIVSAYRKYLNMIRQAPDERVFWNSRGARFEKLKGDREGQYSFRLNDQFRLIITLDGSGRDKTVRIIEIVDYH